MKATIEPLANAAWQLLFGFLFIAAGTVVFVVLWFAAAAINMWLGISRAGYSFAEELPIFLLIFLLPALAAVLVGWKWFGVFSGG